MMLNQFFTENFNMIQENEYDFDSSDEEDIQNTIGNVPMEWYKNTPHIGYDISGRPLMKISGAKGAVDSFIDNVENVDKTTIIKDPLTGQNVVLSDKDIMLIKGLCSSRGFLSLHTDNEEYVNNWFTRDVMDTPVSARPPQKKSFIPSISDRKRVSKMIYAIKMGRMAFPEPEDKDKVLDSDYDFIMNTRVPDVWNPNYDKKTLKHVSAEYLEWLPKELQPDYQTKYQSIRQIIRPPPEKLPGHEESYNPPEEYLLNEKEKKILISRFYDPSYNPCRQIGERPLIPTVYPNLRSVPYSTAPILEKQKRLRDLAFAARVVKDKVHSSTEQMLKQNIPSYNDLKPFPNLVQFTTISQDVILSLNVSCCGKYIAVVGYEYLTIYHNLNGVDPLSIIRSYSISVFNPDKEDLTIRNPSLAWHPQCNLLALAVASKVVIINPGLNSSKDSDDLELKMKEWYSNSVNLSSLDDEEPSSKKTKLSNNWILIKPEGTKRQERLSSLIIELDETILDMSWHSCGDYFLTISGKGKSTSSGGKVQIHRLSKCASLTPFSGNKLTWLTARFHCQKNVPLLFLAECNTSNIQVYDLAQKKLVKTLQVTGTPSVMEMHPTENHLIVGTFEGKICWFDLDMGISPFKTLNVNRNSVRSITLDSNYPLMACGTANGSVVCFYSKVYSTFDKNPLVVPVSLFEKLDKAVDMYSVCFDPKSLRLYSGGKDKTIRGFESNH